MCISIVLCDCVYFISLFTCVFALKFSFLHGILNWQFNFWCSRFSFEFSVLIYFWHIFAHVSRSSFTLLLHKRTLSSWNFTTSLLVFMYQSHFCTYNDFLTNTSQKSLCVCEWKWIGLNNPLNCERWLMVLWNCSITMMIDLFIHVY